MIALKTNTITCILAYMSLQPGETQGDLMERNEHHPEIFDFEKRVKGLYKWKEKKTVTLGTKKYYENSLLPT